MALMTTRLLAVVMTLVSLCWAHAASGQPGPLDSQAASIQAMTLVGSDVLYAGSFGFGLFRSEDRGATWAYRPAGHPALTFGELRAS